MESDKETCNIQNLRSEQRVYTVKEVNAEEERRDVRIENDTTNYNVQTTKDQPVEDQPFAWDEIKALLTKSSR